MLPPRRRLGLLQLLHPLRLFRTRLSRHSISPRLNDQVVQFAEARVHIVGLLAGVVGLDDHVAGFRGVVPAGEDILVEQLGEKGEQGGGGDAQGGFG